MNGNVDRQGRFPDGQVPDVEVVDIADTSDLTQVGIYCVRVDVGWCCYISMLDSEIQFRARTVPIVPSIKTVTDLYISLIVVASTKTLKINVHMGSTIVKSGRAQITIAAINTPMELSKSPIT